MGKKTGKTNGTKGNGRHQHRDPVYSDVQVTVTPVGRRKGQQPKPISYLIPWRPPFDEAIADEICNLIASGMSLRAICRMAGMPKADHVYHWLWNETRFADQYTRARECQMEAWADEALDIADDARADVVLTEAGTPVTVYENVQRSKLRVETRKWFMSRMAPRKYSERVITETTSLNMNLDVNADLKRMTPDELREEAARLARELGVGGGKRSLGG